ncbi:MAG: lmo0937 family membrane protein [Gemmatimonadales bacterium]
MLITLAVILIILWALGFLAFHVTSGLIHLLLVVALIVIVIRLVTGRRPVV